MMMLLLPRIGVLLLAVCDAFYLPGVAPRTFRYGDKVELKVNKLTSVRWKNLLFFDVVPLRCIRRFRTTTIA